MKQNMKQKINLKNDTLGEWFFLAGLVLSVIFSVFSIKIKMWQSLIIALIGIFTGLLNLTKKEIRDYLIASIAFLVSFMSLSSAIENLHYSFASLYNFLPLLKMLIAPITAIIAFKVIYSLWKAR